MLISKKKGLILAMAVLLSVAALLAASRYFDIRGEIARTVAFFRDAGAGPFFAAMAVLPAAGFPISAFNVVAGPVFGPTLGVGTVIGGAVLAGAGELGG